MIFVTYGRRSRVLDHLVRINFVREHTVKVVDEVAIVDKTRAVLQLVPIKEHGDLALSEVDSEGAEAGAELKENSEV